METTNNFKPILFSTEMVQVILAGRKTQTRRIIKPELMNGPAAHPIVLHEKNLKEYINVGIMKNVFDFLPIKPGDILWVRETFCDVSHNLENENCFLYKADFLGTTAELVKWKPSLFMPKEAARIFLKVTNVRCERLQDISEEDAIAEGLEIVGTDREFIFYKNYQFQGEFHQVPRNSFLSLWDSINGKKYPWESNPWVWVYEFERIEKPENFK